MKFLPTQLDSIEITSFFTEHRWKGFSADSIGFRPCKDIHVFERSDQLGGRARLFNDAGESYEAGASIIHDKNQPFAHALS